MNRSDDKNVMVKALDSAACLSRNRPVKPKDNKMKIPTSVIALFAVTLAIAPPLSQQSNADGPKYAARLISPTLGQVLYPGQQVRVEWKTVLPSVDLSWCELELYLSVDGGATFPFRITPQLDPRAAFFYWTVPNMPTNAAVLDIRFGCEGTYPESSSPQAASPFVISSFPGGLH